MVSNNSKISFKTHNQLEIKILSSNLPFQVSSRGKTFKIIFFIQRNPLTSKLSLLKLVLMIIFFICHYHHFSLFLFQIKIK